MNLHMRSTPTRLVQARYRIRPYHRHERQRGNSLVIRESELISLTGEQGDPVMLPVAQSGVGGITLVTTLSDTKKTDQH